jgi:hypothetical protein
MRLSWTGALAGFSGSGAPGGGGGGSGLFGFAAGLVGTLAAGFGGA